MNDTLEADVKVHVTSMTVHYKKGLEASFEYPPPQEPHDVEPIRKIDPDYVNVQLYYQNKQEERQYMLVMLLKTEVAKKLNLMVGDKLTLKLVKEQDSQ